MTGALGAVMLLIGGGIATLNAAVDRLGVPQLAGVSQVSVSVLDRHDRLLRAFTTPEGRWRLPLEADEGDQRYLAMLMAFEDKRFYQHGGVDL
ncbi:MAG: penicillin-binding protein 1C, partial [Hyphomicrobium sp.]